MKKRIIFENSRYIVFGNPANAKDFIEYYGNFQPKAVIGGFGVTKFDIIEKVRKQYSIADIKKHFDFPANKIVVAVGYNGTKGQQHLKLLNELSALNEEVKQKIFVVLQMTYGFNAGYCNEVQKAVIRMGVKYRLITSFLDDKETSKLRLATDVVLNAQTTDGFSASIQEHIFAGNIVVVGDWLPYAPLGAAGIYYLTKPLGEFANTLKEVIYCFKEMKQATELNRDKIYAISGWNTRIKSWLSIYDGKVEKVLYNENSMHIN